MISVSQIVKGAGNTVVGAIEVLSPQFRVNVSEIEEALGRASEALSTALGGSKTPLSQALEKEIGRGQVASAG